MNKKNKKHFTLYGFVLIVLYWTLESLFDYYHHGEFDFFHYFFSPLPHELYMRLYTIGFIILLIGIIYYFYRKLQKLIEKYHQKSSHLELLIHSIPDLICFKDKDRSWILSNLANLDFFQLSKTSYFGIKDEDILEMNPNYKNVIERCIQSDKYVLERKEKYQAIEEILIHDTKKTFEILKLPIFKDGEINGIVIVGRDITDYQTALERLIYSEDKYKTIFNSVNDGIMIHNPKDGRILDINRKGIEIFGYTKDELLNLDIGELSSNKDYYNQQEALKKIRLAILHQDQVFQWQAKNKNNHDFWVEVQLRKILMDDNERILAVIRDISQKKETEDRMKSLARFPDENPNPVIRADKKGIVLYSNKLARVLTRKWEIQEEQIILPSIIKKELIRSFIESSKMITEYKLEQKIYQVTIAPLITENYANIYFEDITVQKEIEKQLELAKITFDNTSEAVMITDMKGRIVNINRAFTLITGYEMEEIIGKTPAVMKSGKHGEDFYRQMWSSIQSNSFWQGEVWDRKKNGEIYPKWLTINSIRNEEKMIEYYVGIFSDITKMKKNEEYIHFLAHYDVLTELPNRLLLTDRYRQLSLEAEEKNVFMALMFIDLDRFKNINDTLGYGIGDKVLIEVSKRLKKKLRYRDILSRISADEFILLLYGVNCPEGASIEVESILALFEEPFKYEEYHLYVSASIGISLFPTDSHSLEKLIKNAETAMFEAKKMGKNTYRFFSEEMEEKSKEFLHFEMLLRQGIQKEQFELYYQPKVDIRQDRVIGFEALIRWNHPDLGIVSPIRFIPIAEETGLIIKLGYWVIEEACRTLEENYIEYPDLSISVNVSAVQLRQSDFLENFFSIMEKYHFPKKLFDIEITESILMKDIEKNKNTLKMLFEKKIQISIDDFGTGYSSLNYLRNLTLNTLKIDKSFIDEIPEQKDANAVAKSIISLGHNLNLNVLAEGVESVEQLEFLKNSGCDQVQGYYYSPPIQKKNIRKILEKVLKKD